MKELTIRKPVAKDTYQIAGLLKELGYPNKAEFVKSKITELSTSESDTVLVAEVNGKVIGVAHLHVTELFHQYGRVGRVASLVVTNDYRGKGVGQKLMTSLETIARNSGCIKMEVTSAIHRKDAHSFYKSLGYIEKPKRFIKLLE